MAATIDNRVAELERANAELRRQLDACSAELKEARNQQTATAEVLQVINSSPGDLAPVFDAMLEKALHLCQAAFGLLNTYDGERFRALAIGGMSGAAAEPLREWVADPGSALERIVRGDRVVHIPDVVDTEAYRTGVASRLKLVRLTGARTALWVALRKDDALLGAFVIYRREVRPFTDKQIALLQNFAAQAVIAMENARLLTETREALEQQTATAEVLQVINSSPGDLAPVFDAMLEKAVRLCEATFGGLTRVDGDRFHAVAMHNVPQAFAEAMRQPRPMLPGHAHHRLLTGEDVVQVEDVTAEDIYRSGDPSRHALADLGGARTVLWAALRKDNTLLGSFVIYRQEVRPFTDNQIALLQNFAAQAVIAMENARLITGTREALEQQTATAEVLQVINSSPGDLAPVFDAILEKAHSLCNSDHGTLFLRDGAHFRPAAIRGVPEPIAERLREGLGADVPVVRPLLAGERFVHILDLAQLDHPLADLSSEAGVHALLSVPLRKGDELLGMIVTARFEAGTFSDKQIALLQNFAAQAVIAMENARLLTETREALEQQTATAEVLQVINSSPGDLSPVFDAILEKAHNLCSAPYGSLQVFDGEQFRAAATRGLPEPFAELLRGGYRPLPGSPTEPLVRGEHCVHIIDMAALVAESTPAAARRLQLSVDLAGTRTLLLVPLRKDGVLLGCIGAYRKEVLPFTGKQIALLQNFAAQAVIAMENARLLTKTREALEQQTATAEVLGVINSSPGDLAPVFDAILEKAHTLCGAAHGSLTLAEGEHFRAVAMRGMPERFAEVLRRPFHAGPLGEQLMSGKPFVQIADIATDELTAQFATDNRVHNAAIGPGGVRTLLAVPLRKDGALLGYITANRQEVRPFTDQQIALLQNFAAQAVIAMENARLITETREALEQQTATAEVLQVINSSPGDLAPVFDAMIRKAVRLCGAVQGSLRTFDGEALHLAAWHGDPSFAERARELGPIVLRPGHPMEPLLRGQRVVHLTDAREATANSEDSAVRERVAAGNIRSWLAVALRTDGGLLGSIAVSRQEVRPFTDKQIALLQNFAAQAVIAMENARLLTETREALEQQTATAEVLQVINSSPGNLAPVFDAMLARSIRLCEASFGVLWTYDGERFHAAALRNVPTPYAEFLTRAPYLPEPEGAHGRLVNGESLIHIVNVADTELYRSGGPLRRALVDLGGARSAVAVALRKDDALLGMVVVYRQEVRPFFDKQIALLQNFAAQAVIAMENARLLTETREALEQQTATAEVLQVINSSPGDLTPVFDAMLEKAVRLCDFAFAALWTYDGTQFHPVALHAVPKPFEAFMREHVPPAFERLVRGSGPMHFADIMATEIAQRNPAFARAAQELAGVRTLLLVPLRKDDGLLGVFVAYRQEVRPFTDKQIALLQNFAAQAVIAMENARLLTETREALEQQTATAEVLRVINSSPGDLAPVFDAMLEKATNLCEAQTGVLWTYHGEEMQPAAILGAASGYEEYLRQGLRPLSPNHAHLSRGAALVHIPDIPADPVYAASELARALVELGGVRTILMVPMRKDGATLGAFCIYRKEPRPFSDKQIALLRNFAAQAVIAMENARLITETREALEQQTATAEVLQVINSSPGDLAPVFDAMLEKALHLCGAPYGILWNYDGEFFEVAAQRGVPKAFLDTLSGPQRPTSPETTRGRLVAGEHVVHITNLGADLLYQSGDQHRRALVDAAGAQVVVAVSLRKDDKLLGAFTIYRQEARPFSDKQIALVTTFADQAVIAMENARLITETREALEQQTATAEVLQVINSSPGDLAPVFNSMLERATRLCGAAYGHLWTYDGEFLHPFVSRGHRDVAAWFHRAGPRRPSPDEPLGRVLAGEHFIQITDALIEEGYKVVPEIYEQLRLNNIRTILLIPLRKEDVALGVFVVYRQEVRSFTGKQIALLQNFAAQAVIAMENARLITETREALEQQTATAEVLQVINSSPGDLAPVFDAMLAKAMHLCEAAFGILWTYDGERLHSAGMRGIPDAFADFAREPLRPGPETGLGRVLRGERLIHIRDIKAEDSYRSGDRLRVATVELAGARTLLVVPLRKDSAVLGAIAAYRQEVRPFSDKQIALLQNFAAQAVIAMENARLLTETREALEQQTATAEVLQVINSSPGDLAPVFDAVLEKATRLCEAPFGILRTWDGERLHFGAVHGDPQFSDWVRQRGPIRPDSDRSPMGRILAGERVVSVADAPGDEGYRTSAGWREMVEASGVRSAIWVALHKDDALLGYITVYRQEARPFSDKQIALLQNFAAQAVIAMENARLLTETREALEQQTATAEVLQVINSSPGDLAPVFDAMLEKAMRLCEAAFGTLWTYDEDRFRSVAQRGVPGPYADYLTHNAPPASAGTGRERILRGEPFVHVADLKNEEPYRAGDPHRRAMVDLGGARTGLIVPLHKDDAVIGFVMIYRQQVRPFAEKQIALLQNFAAQAVIAIENARLLGELRQRTGDLQESLEYQTATSDVLKVISQSTFDLEPVLQTVLDTAIRLCGNSQGEIFRLEDGVYRMAVGYGMESEYHDIEAKLAITPGPDTLVGRTALAGRPVQIVDALADPEYQPKDDARIGKLRSMLGVPLLREGVPIGVICTARKTVEPFTEKQIALVTTFADQAVIAIENARLFNELRERTAELGRSIEELKMLGEVGRAVSSTLDLRAVLSTILTASLGMTWATAGAIFRYIRAERAFRLVEAVGWDEALLGSVGDLSIAETETAMSEAALQRTPIQLTDLALLPSTRLRDASLAAGLRSVLIVPLVGPERIFGALVLQRREAGEFPAETVRLMQTLASQSVLAIQNARLFREIADKSEQLALASQHKSQFLANMSHELRTPLNAILGYAELLVDGIYGVLPEKAQGVLERVQNNGKHLLALINDVLDLAKIEAGQLALTLEDYALAEVVRGVVTATEPLAVAKGLKFTAIVQDDMPMAHGDARRVSQVLLNLAGNAIKFTDAGEVEINASAANGQFVLTVRDTGPGIADADQERIFGEFQQIENTDTRKKGGTGLGLAISKRMVEMQGGMISVESTLGRGSTFRVVLPVHVEPALEEAA